MSGKPIAFTKVKLPYGWLGNMSRHPVKYDGEWWPTTEHLFQALRFDDPAIKQKILAEPNPFMAKLVAERHQAKMAIPQRGRRDVANIERVLRLKLKHHPELREELLATGNQTIIEDCSNRPGGSGKFWGAAWQDGQWVGENVLGRLWMKLRSGLKKHRPSVTESDFTIEDIQTLQQLMARLGQKTVVNLLTILT